LPGLRSRSPFCLTLQIFLLTFATDITPAWPQSKNQDNPSPVHSIATRLKGSGIPRFAQVSENLYRGGQPSAQGLQDLQGMGVQVIVDLRGSPSQTERVAVTNLGMEYVSIPSHCPFPSDKPWARFLDAVRKNRGKKVFVHCRLGDDRTGLAVATYRIAEQGWSADEALREMKVFGFRGVHHVVCPRMAEYVKKFPERLRTSRSFRGLAGEQGSK
jgi:protein tyrosine/serine phosphatase